MYAHAAAALGLRYLPMLQGVGPNMFLSTGELPTHIYALICSIAPLQECRCQWSASFRS